MLLIRAGWYLVERRAAATSCGIITTIFMDEYIARIHMGDELHSITVEYNRILADLSKLSIGAPSASRKAVAKAEKALKNDDETTFSEEEIDQFLPASLKGGLTIRAGSQASSEPLHQVGPKAHLIPLQRDHFLFFAACSGVPWS